MKRSLAQLAAEQMLPAPHELAHNEYPRLTHIPATVLDRFSVVATEPVRAPEYVYVALDPKTSSLNSPNLELEVFMAEWNARWEAGDAERLFGKGDLPARFSWLRDAPSHNLRFVPRIPFHRYDAYAPLFHLLPSRTLKRFGLPPLKKGIWPHSVHMQLLERILPRDFDQRLARAFAYHVWPLLSSGRPSAFAVTEPLRLLAHNLDYWMPYVDVLAQQRVRQLGRVPFDDEEQFSAYRSLAQKLPSGLRLERPHYGGDLWRGEDEAREATREMVELADQYGRLRGIIEAVRSGRVLEDFSDRWSYAREDFERKLYRKRAKVKVSFVELDDTLPVHGPESEIHEELLWEDFIALLEPKERRIVICLRSGATRLNVIAKELGYANHSPISKALARIRHKAIDYLEI